MFVDYLIAGGICVLTIGVAYMGVHVTLHPQDSPKAKRLWKVGFIVATLATCTLVVWQTKRNGDAQRILQAQLDQIQKNTSQPPQVKVENQIDTSPIAKALQTPTVVHNIKSPELQIFYNNKKLDGQTILIHIPTGAVRLQTMLQLQAFHVKNNGGVSTGPVGARLYFSHPSLGGARPWETIDSDDPKYPQEFYLGGGPISPQETATWYPFEAFINPPGLESPIKARLQLFYGGPKPAEAHFVIRREEP